MKAFMTGSRVYGVPKEDSDYDLVVRMSQVDFDILKSAKGIAEGPSGSAPSHGGFCPMRFDSLNLLVCLTDEWYEVWARGTEECKASDELVCRDDAVAVFKKYEKELGVREKKEMVTND